MVKSKTTIYPLVHNDDTVLKETEMVCATKEEFIDIWETRKSGNSKVKWAGNIEKLTITAKEWIHYTKAFGDEEE